MRILKLIVLTLLMSMAMTSNAQAQDAAQRPNVVFILIDDMGYRDLSCFGGDRAKTPNIDRLAAEGMRFEQFYVASPICSPSRVGFTTGQYPQRWSITSFLSSAADNRQRGMADWLDPKAPSLARMLSNNGYYTAHVGKWHMGGQRDVGDAPMITEYGFDTSVTNFEGLGDRILANFRKKPNGEDFGHGPTVTSARFGGPGVVWVDRWDVSAAYVDRAIAEMKKAQSANKPFYINLWPDDVHSPMQAPEERLGDGTPPAQYVGVLEELDEQLGRLVDAIRNDESLRDNTIIALASDNGHEGGLGSGGSLRGSKGQLYEGGIRSPLVVWAPNRMEKSAVGTVNEKTVVQAIDFAPSILAIAGIEKPADVKFDGKDLSAQLMGKSTEPRGAVVMWERPPDRGGRGGSLPDLAIRDGKWKLLVNRDGSKAELYDIFSDPDESNNLAEKNPEVASKLTKQVTEWAPTVQPAGKPLRSNVKS